MNIKKLEQIKTALSKILEIEKAEFRQSTDEAGNILSWEADTELPEVDAVVYVEGEEGEKAVAPAGEYVLADSVGQRIKITVGEGGVVTATEVVGEEEVAEEPEAEEIVEAIEDAAEEEPEAQSEDPDVTIVEETVEDITKVKDAEIEALKAEIEALKAENEELKAKVAELEAEPSAEPVEQQFEAMQKKQKFETGAAKYAQALRK